MELLSNSNLVQLIDQHTRHRINQNSSTLTSDANLISKPSNVIIHKKINFTNISNDLINQDWDTLLTRNMETMWCTFVQVLEDVTNSNTIFFKRHKNLLKRYFNEDMLRRIGYKRGLWRKYRQTGLRSDYIIRRTYSNEFSVDIKKLKSDYENRLLKKPRALTNSRFPRFFR